MVSTTPVANSEYNFSDIVIMLTTFDAFDESKSCYSCSYYVLQLCSALTKGNCNSLCSASRIPLTATLLRSHKRRLSSTAIHSALLHEICYSVLRSHKRRLSLLNCNSLCSASRNPLTATQLRSASLKEIICFTINCNKTTIKDVKTHRAISYCDLWCALIIAEG